MSKIMSEKDQKAIQKAEEIIAEVKQNGLKGGALVVLRATNEGDDTSLNRMVVGEVTPTLTALCFALVEVCKTYGFPLTRVASCLLEIC